MDQNSTDNKWMSVREMGDLLGIKKVDRYWLVHKEVFETQIFDGKMRVNVESFEKWYANQIKYQKITGEEPGKELKAWSYSPRDIAGILDISESDVYEIIRKDRLETVLVDYWKRIPKKAFEEWYQRQSKYRNAEDRKRDEAAENATLTMPQMGQVLGIDRRQVYALLDRSIYTEVFDTVVITDRRRVTRESIAEYIRLLLKNSAKQIVSSEESRKNDYPEGLEDAVREYREKDRRLCGSSRGIGNIDYVTLNEAAVIAGVSRQTITYWGDQNYIGIISLGRMKRVSRLDLENWIRKRRNWHGIH